MAPFTICIANQVTTLDCYIFNKSFYLYYHINTFLISIAIYLSMTNVQNCVSDLTKLYARVFYLLLYTIAFRTFQTSSCIFFCSLNLHLIIII